MQALKDSPIILTSLKDVQEICKPLVEIIGIDSFCYHKIFPNGQEICLSNNPHWLKYVYQNNLTFGLKLDMLETTNFKALLWPLDNKIPGYKAVREIWDCHYGIDLANGKNEYFGFSSHQKDISVVNNFINHIEQLERFTQYFTEKAEQLISQVSQNKTLSYKSKKLLQSQKQLPLKDIFAKRTPINGYQLNTGPLQNLKFTLKELECIKFFIRGYTTLETAISLGISKRTAETHLENIKNKTGINKKSELIKFIFDNKLDPYFS